MLKSPRFGVGGGNVWAGIEHMLHISIDCLEGNCFPQRYMQWRVIVNPNGGGNCMCLDQRFHSIGLFDTRHRSKGVFTIGFSQQNRQTDFGFPVA
jgi:hypothetical protein